MRVRGSLEVLWELFEVHKPPKATTLDTFICGGERGKRGEERRGERGEERGEGRHERGERRGERREEREERTEE